MAEVFRYSSGEPSFSEVLAIIDRWQQAGELGTEDLEQAKVDLASCISALEGKDDLMSQMARGKVNELLAQIGG